MRRFTPLVVPALLVGLLAACGGDGSSTAVAGLPSVSGEYGAKPKISVDKGSDPGKKLQSEILSTGSGPKVAVGDLLVADYLGKVYKSGKVFDNSYDRGAPSSFTLKIGQGGVISGWVKSLKGVPVGSRVLLVAPPKDGYGKQGNPQAGIKGTDSLVFVVDVIAAYNGKSPLPDSTPVPDLPATLPAVTGDAEPTITIAEGTPPPAEPKTTVLATGLGADVVKGELGIVQFSAVGWSGEALRTTWTTGPEGVAIGGEQPSPFDLLVGIPVGSRVLLELPAQEGADPATESVAVVVDVLGQHGTAKKESEK